MLLLEYFFSMCGMFGTVKYGAFCLFAVIILFELAFIFLYVKDFNLVKSAALSQETVSLISDWCHHLRQDLSKLFAEDMKTFLEALPKQLVDAAEKLPTHEQQAYYDIISLLQTNKGQLAPSIRNAIALSIEEFVQFVTDVDVPKKHDTLHNLTLIDTDEIEVSIIIEGQAGRVAAKVSEPLNDAYLRLSQLVPAIKLPTQLPCHPKVFVLSMLESLTILSLQTEHKIILIKQFTQFVSTEALAEIIENSLVQAKIPVFNHQIKRQSHYQSKQPKQQDEQQLEQQPESAEQQASAAYQQPQAHSAAQLQQPQLQQLQPQPHPQSQQPQQGLQANAQPSHAAANMLDDDLLGAASARYSSSSYASFEFGGEAVGSADGGAGGTITQPHMPVVQQQGHTQGNMSQVNAGVGGTGITGTHSALTPEQMAGGVANQHSTRTNELAQAHANAPLGSHGISSTQLLNQLGHLRQLRSQMAKSPIVPAPKNPLVAEQALTSKQVDKILVDLQQAQSTVSVREDTQIQSVEEVRSLIREQLHSDEDTLQTIDDKESDIINLVSMMFDHILDNPNLPTDMKALLARLQIPMLRVALMTPDFIANTAHPSRKLLDKLAEAGISLDKSNKKDRFFDKLESFVFRILKDFQSDQEIFAKLYDELVAFLEEEESRSLSVEKRTLETEQKKAESQLAKSEVQKQLNARLLGKKLPFCVVKVLQNGWWQVLYHTNIRYGIDSDRWKNALKIVDALVWSVLPPTKSHELVHWLDQLEKVQPKLLSNLEKGLHHINFDPLQQSQLMRDIKQIHTDLLAEKEVAAIDVTSSEEKLTADEQFKLDTSSPANQKVALPIDAITASVQEVEDMEMSETLATMSANVRELKTGDWVEFDVHTEEPKRRKLVARVRTLNKLVFTNRRGIKVAEVTSTKLAQLLVNGEARIIEKDSHIVDTALGAVIDNVARIESMQPETALTV